MTPVTKSLPIGVPPQEEFGTLYIPKSKGVESSIIKF